MCDRTIYKTGYENNQTSTGTIQDHRDLSNHTKINRSGHENRPPYTRVWHELLSHMQLALDSPVSNRVLSLQLATQITYIQPLSNASCMRDNHSCQTRVLYLISVMPNQGSVHLKQCVVIVWLRVVMASLLLIDGAGRCEVLGRSYAVLRWVS